MPCQLAVCAIVQNVAPRLLEWVAFHQLVGVERFFLYDNDSTDDTAAIAERIDGVTVHDWPGARQQMPAYRDALQRHAGDAEWIAFIDGDEFLWSPTGLPLPTLLNERYADHVAVAACWLMFGTSHLERPPRLRLNRFVHRAASDIPEHRHVKSIVRPGATRRPITPHHFEVATVDEHGRRFTGPWAPNPSWDVLRINHYVTGSISEAIAKSERQRADTGNTVGCRDEFLSDKYNAVMDTDIGRYLPLLRARLSVLA